MLGGNFSHKILVSLPSLLYPPKTTQTDKLSSGFGGWAHRVPQHPQRSVPKRTIRQCQLGYAGARDKEGGNYQEFVANYYCAGGLYTSSILSAAREGCIYSVAFRKRSYEDRRI